MSKKGRAHWTTDLLWLTIYNADTKPLDISVRPLLPHSTSLGNNMEKDVARGHAFNQIYSNRSFRCVIYAQTIRLPMYSTVI